MPDTKDTSTGHRKYLLAITGQKKVLLLFTLFRQLTIVKSYPFYLSRGEAILQVTSRENLVEVFPFELIQYYLDNTSMSKPISSSIIIRLLPTECVNVK